MAASKFRAGALGERRSPRSSSSLKQPRSKPSGTSLARSSRDDLQLILFSTLIVALMVGGTLVILFNLHGRMM